MLCVTFINYSNCIFVLSVPSLFLPLSGKHDQDAWKCSDGTTPRAHLLTVNMHSMADTQDVLCADVDLQGTTLWRCTGHSRGHSETNVPVFMAELDTKRCCCTVLLLPTSTCVTLLTFHTCVYKALCNINNRNYHRVFFVLRKLQISQHKILT